MAFFNAEAEGGLPLISDGRGRLQLIVGNTERVAVGSQSVFDFNSVVIKQIAQPFHKYP